MFSGVVLILSMNAFFWVWVTAPEMKWYVLALVLISGFVFWRIWRVWKKLFYVYSDE